MVSEKIQRVKAISRTKDMDKLQQNDIDFISECLKDESVSLVASSYWTVGQVGIKKPDLVEKLIDQAFNDLNNTNPEIRENALFAIGRTGRAKIELVEGRIDRIMNMHKDPNPKVRMSMIWACENIANSNASLFSKYIMIFESLLDDPDEKYVRSEAPEIFRVIGKYKPNIVKGSLDKLKDKLNDSCRVTRIHSAGAIRIIEKNLG